LTVSIGLAVCPDDAQTAEALLEAADVALYRAKKSGRDMVVKAGAR
jgi:diguanylate cyclase (GGDEF)-like protein